MYPVPLLTINLYVPLLSGAIFPCTLDIFDESSKIFRRVSAGALIGLFVSLGIAIPVRINRKKKEEKERNRQMNDMFYDSTYNLSGRRNRNRTGTYFDPNDNQYGGNSRLL